MAASHRNKQELLKELTEVLSESTHDDQSTTDEEYAGGLLKAHKQIVQRNLLLTNLLNSYIRSHSKKVSDNRLYKGIMFFTFLAVFFAFSVTTLVVTLVVLLSANFSEINIPQVLSLLSVGATYIGSIFVAYEIMFKYLFPTDEEKDMISMIRTVIENDLKVEEFTSSRFTDRTTKSQKSYEQDDHNN